MKRSPKSLRPRSDVEDDGVEMLRVSTGSGGGTPTGPAGFAKAEAGPQGNRPPRAEAGGFLARVPADGAVSPPLDAAGRLLTLIDADAFEEFVTPAGTFGVLLHHVAEERGIVVHASVGALFESTEAGTRTRCPPW